MKPPGFLETFSALALSVGVLLSFNATPARAADSQAAHHDARVRLDPAQGTVEVRNTVVFEAQGRVALRLNPAFVVESLSLNGNRRAPDRHGDFLSVDVGNSGVHTIALHTRANLATQTAHETPPFMNAEGGFFARGWLGHPRDRRATYRIEVTTALPHIAVVPGAVQKERRTETQYTAVFSSDVPDDPPVLITGPFDVGEKILEQTPPVRLRTYFHSELAPLADGYLDDAARYITHYSRTIGPYPYAGFAMVSGPMPIGIGLPGMTYMGRRVLALPFIRSTSLPHEVLHNWWGNAVFVDYANGNWAEGLTTYQADHAQSASQNQDGGRDKRLEWLRNYAALPPTSDSPVTAFRSKTHDASQVVGYGKVAFIFHMLKMQLGADGFDQAIQRFYADNRYRTAGWPQIKAAFEAQSGTDLGPFFDAWLTRTGAPELALEDVAVEGQRLSFTLVQTQQDAAYPLSLTVDVETRADDQRLVLNMTKKRQRYTVQTDAVPVAMTVDPALDVFRRLDIRETPAIFRDVTLNPDTRLIAPGQNPQDRAVARALAEALMQGPLPETQANTTLPLKNTLIVAGLKAEVLAFLQKNGLPLPPQSIDASSEAVAYVMRDAKGRVTLVAMADDSTQLSNLARVLPHYKRRSFALMQGGVVTDKGTWPATAGPLYRRLD